MIQGTYNSGLVLTENSVPWDNLSLADHVMPNIHSQERIFNLHLTKIVSLVYMNLVRRKPVFGACDQVTLKPACSATEAS